MRGTPLVPGAEVGVRVHGLHVGGLLGGLLGAEVPVPGHHHEVLGVEVLVQLRADGGGDDPPGRDHRARAVVSAQPQQLRSGGVTLCPALQLLLLNLEGDDVGELARHRVLYAEGEAAGHRKQ